MNDHSANFYNSQYADLIIYNHVRFLFEQYGMSLT